MRSGSGGSCGAAPGGSAIETCVACSDASHGTRKKLRIRSLTSSSCAYLGGRSNAAEMAQLGRPSGPRVQPQEPVVALCCGAANTANPDHAAVREERAAPDHEEGGGVARVVAEDGVRAVEAHVVEALELALPVVARDHDHVQRHPHEVEGGDDAERRDAGVVLPVALRLEALAKVDEERAAQLVLLEQRRHAHLLAGDGARRRQQPRAAAHLDRRVDLAAPAPPPGVEFAALHLGLPPVRAKCERRSEAHAGERVEERQQRRTGRRHQRAALVGKRAEEGAIRVVGAGDACARRALRVEWHGRRAAFAESCRVGLLRRGCAELQMMHQV